MDHPHLLQCSGRDLSGLHGRNRPVAPGPPRTFSLHRPSMPSPRRHHHAHLHRRLPLLRRQGLARLPKRPPPHLRVRMSPLPITPYLMAALEDGYRMGEMTLSHHGAGDPFMVPHTPPFKLSMPRGRFPVTLSIAYIKTDQRVAFATLRLTQTLPASWEMLTVGNQEISTLKEDELFGY